MFSFAIGANCLRLGVQPPLPLSKDNAFWRLSAKLLIGPVAY